MNPGVRPVSVAVLAALTAASACLAAEPGGGPGKGGIGGQIGASYFRLDRALGSDWFGDYSAGAGARLAFHGHWRYQVNSWLRWQLGTGFTWAGYRNKFPAPFVDPNFPDDFINPSVRGPLNKGEYLTLLVPATAQLHFIVRRGWWNYYGGAGPGVYRVWVENHRKVLKDPQSLKLHRGLYPGASAELGVERFLRDLPNTSLELALAGHLAMAQRHDQFPSGFDSNVMALEVRLGGNYYFTPGPRKASGTNSSKRP